MTISIGGVGSGIDTQGLIDQIMSAAQAPLTALQTKKSNVDSATTTISSLSSKLAALKTAALALSTSTGFASFSASSSDAAVVATANGGASNASYTVGVTALAHAQKSRSDVQTSASSALGATGKLTLNVGSAAGIDVTVDPSDSLSDLATKISASGARVSASIFNDGTGYRLLVQGLDSGAANTFTIDETSVSLGLSAGASVYQTANDAKLTVDGMPVTSSSNQITGVIPGVKLALTNVTTTPATVQITTDPSGLEKKVNAFVSAYNDVVNTGHTAAGFGATKATNPVLAGDISIRSALHRMGGIMSAAVPGSSGAYTSLASIGLTTTNDGLAAFDATKLEAALSADGPSVARLFVTDKTTGATGMMSTMMSAIDSLVTGTSAPLAARLTTLGNQSKGLQTSEDKMQTQLDDYQTRLKKQFSDMDQAVSKYNALAKQLPQISTTNNSSSG